MSTTRRSASGLTSLPEAGSSPVIRSSADSVSVRPARLDRQLRQGSLDAGYSDPRLEEIVQAAAEEAREAARAQGYATGWTQGRRAAAAQATLNAQVAQEELRQLKVQAAQEITALLANLAAASATTSQISAQEWSEVADVLGQGAIQLAQALLARELSSVDDTMQLNIRTALQCLADPGQAVIHLHPQDAVLIQDAPDGVRIVPDPAVPVGGVVALTPTQRVRLDLAKALEAAQEVLNG
jgi:flagellar assembly protein FliH